jgi:hypothetical protein
MIFHDFLYFYDFPQRNRIFSAKKNWPSLLDVVRVGSVGTHPQDPGEKGQSIGGIGAPILIKTDDRY